MAKRSQSISVPTLFDDLVRTDPAPASDGEDSFTFLNRVDQPFWCRVRDQLEKWFGEYPMDATADLVGRFRDFDSRQHFAAWWKLYLFTLYRRLGYSVTVHPTVAGTTAQPDFLVARGDEELYVEAAVVFSGIEDEQRHAAREAWIYDLVNKATNPNFHVALEFDRLGMQRPKETELIRPLEQWLAGLDPIGLLPRLMLEKKRPSFVCRCGIGGSYSQPSQSNPNIEESLADYLAYTRRRVGWSTTRKWPGRP